LLIYSYIHAFVKNNLKKTTMAISLRILYLDCVCFSENGFRKILFQTFMFLFAIRKAGQRSMKNTFQSKKNLAWFPGKCFSFILGGKHFLEVVKILKMLYYLLIISNLVLKLLIATYILFWIFVFQFHPLEFNFYINFGPHFYLLFTFSLSFFNWNFLSIKFGPHSFYCYLFYLK
jgi:hypothetical protein